MAKKIVMSQFGNLTPNHKRLKKRIKSPFNWTCDMKLESLFKCYNFPLRDFQSKLVCKDHEPIKSQDS